MRKICLITTSRADYGIQSRLIRLLNDDSEIDFSLIATGTHISSKHGNSYQEIEQDNIKITKQIDIGIDTIDSMHVEKIMANALVSISEALREISPDLLIVLGDRYEMCAAALAATLCNIPIAHLHGGESTFGIYDQVFRHAITKASHFHFTTCEEYRKRVIQLGEHPETVFNVGSLGVENILKLPLLSEEEIFSVLKIKKNKHNVLVTFHPVTFEQGKAKEQVTELLCALRELNDTNIIFTGTNADSEGDIIGSIINDFVKQTDNCYSFISLGAVKYLSLARQMDMVIGNSSSGIIEIPSFNIPTINIGNRQAGRIQASSVLNCLPIKKDILETIRYAYSEEFKNILKTNTNPYEKADTAKNILNILKNVSLENVLEKKFFDINFSLE